METLILNFTWLHLGSLEMKTKLVLKLNLHNLLDFCCELQHFFHES